MPSVGIFLWNRMVATLWTAVMALLRRNVTGQVAELESSLRETSPQSVPASTENVEERKSETTASKKSFLSSILQAQQTGRIPWKLRKLPKEVNKRLKVPKSRGRGGSRKNMAWLCEKLDRRTVKFKQSSCLKVVGAIRELVSEVGCTDYAENRDALLLLRGDMLLVKLLLISDRVESNSKEGSRRHERGPLLQLQAMCLQTLQDLCYVSRTCLENLCWDNDLLLFLFKSMQAKELFSTALGLAEEMVGFRDKQLDLCNIPDFEKLVGSLGDEQLASFCRLLTLTVSGPEQDYRDPIEKVSDCGIMDWTKPRSRWSVAKPLLGNLEELFSEAGQPVTLSEKNHALLLDLPGLLPRLVKLLASKRLSSEISFSEFLSETLQPLLRTHPTIEDGAPPEVQTLIRLMRGGLHGARIAHGTGGANTLEIVVDPAATPEENADDAEDVRREMQRTIEQQAWQYKVEILFMFCSICEGREVVRMQDELAKLGLVPVLKDLFDSLDWDAPIPTGPQETHGLHGPGCECNPEMTMKVQLLKMVHSLCDRSSANGRNKALFVLPDTLGEEPLPPPSNQPNEQLEPKNSPEELVEGMSGSKETGTFASDTGGARLGRSGFGAADRPAVKVSDADVASDDVASVERPGTMIEIAVGRVVPHEWNQFDDEEIDGLVAERVLPHEWNPFDDEEIVGLVEEEEVSGKDEEESGTASDGSAGNHVRWPGEGQSSGEASTSGSGADEGLMAKIIRTLMKQTSASSFRFWLASCIEVFMRGSDPRHQENVAQFGLMEHIVDQILKPGFQLSSEYQINFDLLSELVKFNPAMFARLNRLLEGPKFDRFMEVVTEHLVDTNVFLRALVLSLQFFKQGMPWPPYLGLPTVPCEQDGSDGTPLSGSVPPESSAPSPHSGSGSYSASYHKRAALADPDSCKLEMFVACNRTRLLFDLMKAVDKDDVTQDNMCVVNTSLLFFIFARREGQLLPLLQRLRARERGGARALRNFRSLLEYWKHYYLCQRGRDSRSIEYSTNVPFREWLRMVETLTGPEEEPLSLTFGLM